MTTVSDLSIADAVRCGAWSKLAYSDGPFPLGWKLVNMLPSADVQCLVIPSPVCTVFAFRGTDDISKWIMDAKVAFFNTGRNGEKCHLGFHEAVAAIAPVLDPIAAQSTLPIIVTGHSAGAAMARQYVRRLALGGVMAAHSITFGEPRSFNRVGAKIYDALGIPTWRVIDEDDIVCRIPWRFGLYRHTGNSAFFDFWGNVAINEPWYAHVPSDISAAVAEWRAKRGVAFISDHPMDRYIDRLAKAAKRVEAGDV